MRARLRESHRRGLISLRWLGFQPRLDRVVPHPGVAVVVPRLSSGFADGRDQCVSCRYLRTSKILCRHLALGGGALLTHKLPWLSAVWICVARPYSPFLNKFKSRQVKPGVAYSWRAVSLRVGHSV